MDPWGSVGEFQYPEASLRGFFLRLLWLLDIGGNTIPVTVQPEELKQYIWAAYTPRREGRIQMIWRATCKLLPSHPTMLGLRFFRRNFKGPKP